MSLETILSNNLKYLHLLEKLILKKLEGDEIIIGIGSKDTEDCAIISFDEYDRENNNLHLYCSINMEFTLGICTIDDDDLQQEEYLIISPENTLFIPEGLRNLMQQVATKKQDAVFKPNQIND
ncbi:hypothetical protein [Mucilaginibacter sp. OK098]|uniref:hypothetical protein n=1 Tax=Mucilaginibacter sp. OK098 TaxID=1855297 RepID=UPI00091C3A0A|nr:hypothetical protein [Mucilaginibacter sp. OK098]SHN01851.1 hypothetical protein SAMN05216524_104594 [Mucilaginibacter sp. OK098]